MKAVVSAVAIDRVTLAAGLLVLAAAGHALAAPLHADPGLGGALHAVAFAAVAAAQLVGAAALARGPKGNRRRVLVLVGSAVLVALWAVSRTLGLPFGPHGGEAEAIGGLDALTVVVQIGVIGLLASEVCRRRLPMAFAASIAVATVGMVALNAPHRPLGVTSHGHDRSQGSHVNQAHIDRERGHTHDDAGGPHTHP